MQPHHAEADVPHCFWSAGRLSGAFLLRPPATLAGKTPVYAAHWHSNTHGASDCMLMHERAETLLDSSYKGV